MLAVENNTLVTVLIVLAIVCALLYIVNRR